ncbi:MAG TPA: PrsW family glutamic-type intramembrane protease [Polyangium sp.]|nr:PrsW family glutamic-type intramembrane protease [Polyangium sp.]
MNNPYGSRPAPPHGSAYPQPSHPGHHQQQPPQGYGYGRQPSGPVEPPDPDKRRRTLAFGLWGGAILVGIVLNILFTLAEIAFSKAPGRMLSAVITGAIFAFLPLGFYLFIPMVIDRYDPEPWWTLAMAFFWGAIVATGFAGMINTGVHIVSAGIFGPKAGNFITTVISAPLSEEFFKGLAILGMFFFLRREFDGIVDGIIYATFCALGFAAVENVSYYARAEMANQLVGTFFLRGILAPWGHPLYTSMTGIGFGIARESSEGWVRVMAPIGGFFIGVFLHALWNFVPTVIPDAFFIMLLFWFLFVMIFFVILIVLVRRKGNIIGQYLRDEVLMGNMTQQEVDLVTSPFGRLSCTFGWQGAEGRAFIGAASRLALSKWHTARAMKGQKRTISADFIGPLRQEIARLRAQLNAKAPRR